jgi:hypothetical protein
MEELSSRPERRTCSLTDVALVRLAWCLGIVLGLALVHPAPLFTTGLSALLGAAALLVAISAALAHEPLLSHDLGRWDVAAILYLLGRLLGGMAGQDELSSLLWSHGLNS